jgi:hypothetical protein
VAQALHRPSPVYAEGENIQVGGEYMTATSVTWIANSSAASTNDVLRADAVGSGIGVNGTSGSGPGVVGYSVLGNGIVGGSSSGYGVYSTSSQATSIRGEGFEYSGVHGSSENAFGVWGTSSFLYGGYFEGGKAQLRLAPKATAGKPTSGSHLKGEFYLDSKGSLFICTANGTPGTWKKVLTKLV